MIGSITGTDLFGRALITEDAATVAAVMLSQCGLESGTDLHSRALIAEDAATVATFILFRSVARSLVLTCLAEHSLQKMQP